MRIEYSLDESDLMAFQLFAASQSKRIAKKRLMGRTLLPVVYLAFGVWFFIHLNIAMLAFSVVIAVLWVFLYPVYDRRRYERHYKGYIQENLLTNIDKPMSITFEENSLFAADEGSEGNILYSEIQEIKETGDHLFIKFKSAQSFAIPKRKLLDFASLKAKLQEIANRNSFMYLELLDWKWK